MDIKKAALKTARLIKKSTGIIQNQKNEKGLA
jgi:hypothetical protein